MAKVLVATVKPFAKAAVEGIQQIFSEAGYEMTLLEKYDDKSGFINAVSDADALIIRSDKADKEIIEAANNLKIIVRAGAGYDNIDLEAATAKGITAMNTPGQNANAVAELALGMMVYAARNCFNGQPGTELRGKTLGLHAYGNVGKFVSAIAKGFGMDVSAFDPFVPEEKITSDGLRAVKTIEELYSTNQYISLHIPANEKTKNSINFDLLSKMPANATLVNTARAEVICEESIQKIFAERDDFQYATDITPGCHETLTQYGERYYATPKKMGAQTKEANINAGLAAARQIVNFLEKGDTTFKVN